MRLHAKQSDPCALRFVNADDFKQTWDVLSMDPDDIKWDAEKLIDPERIKDTDLTANFFSSVEECPPPTEEPTGLPTGAPTAVPAADRGGVPTPAPADGVPTPARGSGEDDDSKTGIIIGAVIGGLLLCLLLAAGVFFMTKRKPHARHGTANLNVKGQDKKQLLSLINEEGGTEEEMAAQYVAMNGEATVNAPAAAQPAAQPP